ncbi:MAG: hypothetical protein QME81_11815 [bacterium]|nr:hypothetical protein [bacterium]
MGDRILQLLLGTSGFIWTIFLASTPMAKELTPQSAVCNPQSAICSSQSAIRNPQSEIRNPKSEKDRFLTASMILLGTSGILHLMADSSYQRYDEARDKVAAETERERTELLDTARNIFIGMAGVCVAVFEYRHYTAKGDASLKLARIDGRPSLRLAWMW